MHDYMPELHLLIEGHIVSHAVTTEVDLKKSTAAGTFNSLISTHYSCNGCTCSVCFVLAHPSLVRDSNACPQQYYMTVILISKASMRA